MMQQDNEDLLLELAKETGALEAPHKLQARLYSALIAEQEKSGPLRSLPATKMAGYGLCVFEELVRIAPVGAAAKQPFICWRCHARVLAEHLENAPIWWPHCPYSEFQKS
jgi:hypothetical protein